MTFDYHGMRLFDARDKICDDIIEAYEDGLKKIQLIHGYKHGYSIRSYVWGIDGLRKDLKSIRPDISINLRKGNSKAVTWILITS